MQMKPEARQAAQAAFLSEALALQPADRARLLSELDSRSCRGRRPLLANFWTILTVIVVALYAAAIGLGHLRPGGTCLIFAGEFLSDAARYPANCDRVCAGLTAVPVEPANISRARFRELYAYTGRPVLVKGAASDWPAKQNWNLTFFRDLYDRYPDSYRTQKRRARYLPFRIELQTFYEALHMSEERQQQPYYFGWSNLDNNVHNELMKYYTWPQYLPLGVQGSVLDWFFIGAAEFGAPVHLDHILRPSWQALIKGRKTWEIQPPSECSSVCQTLRVQMEPGDIFNVDTNQWYHATFNEPGVFSLTIGAEYD
ncbi:hypothetical protein BOX15_Mlig028714g2 [Macrostomum lignano]|uniref:Cupin-like domain-containing protein n=1 Tax=Macrostomum lignano TaxID=282301 RepID=A0A267GRR9_9PLAT|nr:hypothetical protein BOX15_Mlig028714g2 [Macrostomum lignano]